VIVAAAACPHPPLLLRELTGQLDVAVDIRTACLRAINEIAELRPDALVVVGGDDVTGVPRVVGEVDVSSYGTFAPHSATARAPLSLGIAHRLLTEAGWDGATEWRTIAWDADSSACADLGRELADRPDRIALLVMADGSARRGLKAPGYLDERSFGFDQGITDALADGDSSPLRELDAELAEELLARGRAAIQVLGFAISPGDVTDAKTHYLDDPFGVLYFVSRWTTGA
jgi:hypothetical protein